MRKVMFHLTFYHHQKVVLVVNTVLRPKCSPLFLPDSSSSLKTVRAANLPLYSGGSASKLTWIIRVKVVEPNMRVYVILVFIQKQKHGMPVYFTFTNVVKQKKL